MTRNYEFAVKIHQLAINKIKIWLKRSKILTRAVWLGCLLRSLAWKELGVSIVCCLVRVGWGWATDPCLNQGSDIFLLDFWLFGIPPAALPPGFDMMTKFHTNFFQNIITKLCTTPLAHIRKNKSQFELVKVWSILGQRCFLKIR